MTTEPAEPTNSGFGVKLGEQAPKISKQASKNSRPPSTNKKVGDLPTTTAMQLFQGSNRQRTNTTLGLQSSKNSSMRHSMNNLTLQELMAQTNIASINSKAGKGSGRGNTVGKTIGGTTMKGPSGTTGPAPPKMTT